MFSAAFVGLTSKELRERGMLEGLCKNSPVPARTMTAQVKVDHLPTEEIAFALVCPDSASSTDELLVKQPVDDVDIIPVCDTITIHIQHHYIYRIAVEVPTMAASSAKSHQQFVVEPEATTTDDKEVWLIAGLGELRP